VVTGPSYSEPIQIFHFSQRSSVKIPRHLDLKTVQIVGFETFSTPSSCALGEAHLGCSKVRANNPRRERDSFSTVLTRSVQFPPPFRIPTAIAMDRTCTSGKKYQQEEVREQNEAKQNPDALQTKYPSLFQNGIAILPNTTSVELIRRE
jgi:hypothetical protein